MMNTVLLVNPKDYKFPHQESHSLIQRYFPIALVNHVYVSHHENDTMELMVRIEVIQGHSNVEQFIRECKYTVIAFQYGVMATYVKHGDDNIPPLSSGDSDS